MRWCLIALKPLCCFLLFGVSIVVGRMMIVWQGSYQVKCVRRKCRGAMVKGCEVVHISSVVFFGFQFLGRLWKIAFKSLYRMEVQETSLRNVLKEVKFLSKGWF